MQHQNYSADRFSATFALIGTILTWIFFPILAMDYLEQTVTTTNTYTGAYSVIFALCASTLAAFMVSPLFNDGVLIRDVIYAPIAGGVACSTASFLDPQSSLRAFNRSCCWQCPGRNHELSREEGSQIKIYFP